MTVRDDFNELERALNAGPEELAKVLTPEFIRQLIDGYNQTEIWRENAARLAIRATTQIKDEATAEQIAFDAQVARADNRLEP